MPDSPPLQPHQEAAVAAILTALAGGSRRVLVSFPPRTGGVLALVEAATRLQRAGGFHRILFLVPRLDLAYQELQRLKSCSRDVEVGLLSHREQMPYSRSISVATLAAARKWTAEDSGWSSSFDLVFLSDAEFDPETVLRIFSCPVVGLSIAPSLDTVEAFGEPCFHYSWLEAVRHGRVVPWIGIQVRVELGESPRVENGEILIVQPQVVFPDGLAPVLEHLAHLPGDPLPAKTVVFASHHEAASMICGVIDRRYARHGLSARFDRWSCPPDEIARRFRDDDLPRILVSVDRTHGLDNPDVRNVVLLRRVRATGFLFRMATVGARLTPGKEAFNLIDAFDNLDRLDALFCQE